MPTRPNIENVTVPLMRESEIFAAGNPLPLVTEFTTDTTVQDDTYDVYGLEEQLFFRTLDAGTLRIGCGMARESQVFMDVVAGQKPDSGATNHVYVPNPKVQLDVVRQFRVPDDDGYNAVEFYGRWNPVFRVPAGGPRERGTLSAEGRCEVPVRIVAGAGKFIAVMFDVVSLTQYTDTTGTYKATGTGTAAASATVQIPTGASAIKQIPAIGGYRNASKYAFSVEVQKRNATGTAGVTISKYARLPVTTTMVTSAGLVKIYPRDLLGTSLSLADCTHVFITYLCEFSTAPGLLGQPGGALATYRGKYDACVK